MRIKTWNNQNPIHGLKETKKLKFTNNMIPTSSAISNKKKSKNRDEGRERTNRQEGGGERKRVGGVEGDGYGGTEERKLKFCEPLRREVERGGDERK